MKTDIVLLSGQQGAGKTTIARELLHKFNHKPGWVAFELRFAKVIYEMHDFIIRVMTFHGIDVPQKDGELLQLLGTEWGRKKYGDNVWVDVMKGMVKNIELGRSLPEIPVCAWYSRILLVISDCRFRNEFDAFPEALRVRLVATEEVRRQRAESWRENTNHPSEVDLNDYASQGRFDLQLRTDTISIGDCVDLIAAQIDKQCWLEKRK